MNTTSTLYITRSGKRSAFIGCRIVIYFLLCLFLSLPAQGKTSIAELRNKLQQAGPDSAKFKAYMQLFYYYQYSNPDTVSTYLKQGLSLFTLHKYKRGMAGMLNSLGGLYTAQSMLGLGKAASGEALVIFTEMNDKKGIAAAQNVLGVVEGRKGNYYEATGHFLKALKIFEDLGDTIGITDTYIKLGTVNENSNNHDKALEYYYKGLGYLAGKPVTDVAIFLNNNIGASYLGKNDPANAIKYLQIALDESADTVYMQIRILPLINMGEMYSKNGDTVKAVKYLREALEIAIYENLPEDKANILMDIAGLTEKDHNKQLSLLNEAMETAKAIGAKRMEIDILGSIVAVYKKDGNYKQAFLLLDEQKTLADSVFSSDNTRTIANLEALYDLDKLNAKVQKLEFVEQKQRARNQGIIIVTVLVSILLVVIFIFFWKTRILNTELNQREVRLKKASEVKNKLISIIAHDLIGNIGFMPVALALCRNNNVSDQEKDGMLNELELNATASYETLQNMLDWGKAQIQGITLNQSVIRVNDIITEVLVLINIAAAPRHITIHNHVSPATTVYADPDHFRFIIRNLLSNAVKFTPENGHIEITSRPDATGALIIFSVQDSGPGIPPGRIESIFESGSIADGSTSGKGNGIGLKLCKEFVQENGGTIWATSAPGSGAMFSFSLKAAAK